MSIRPAIRASMVPTDWMPSWELPAMRMTLLLMELGLLTEWYWLRGRKLTSRIFAGKPPLLLRCSPGVALGAGEVGILGVDVDEWGALGVELVHILIAALGQNEVA